MPLALATKFREEIEALRPPTIFFFIVLHLVCSEGTSSSRCFSASDRGHACHRMTGELYLSVSDLPSNDGPASSGPYITKADVTVGKEMGRRYLDNVDASGYWIMVLNFNTIPYGGVVIAWASRGEP
jgi:hypothetical protein